MASNNSLFLCVVWFDIENNIAIANLDDTEQPLRLLHQLHPDLNLLPVFRDVLDCNNILLNIEHVYLEALYLHHKMAIFLLQTNF